MRERNEHFSRIGDHTGALGQLQADVANPAGCIKQFVEILSARMEQRLGFRGIQGDAVVSALQRAADGGCVRDEILNGFGGHD